MPFITALDKDTIRSIHAGQVITTIESIVKELLENSLDAKANTIDIRLVNDGLQKIEVRDNGCGIALDDRSNMARQHYTSKLTSFADLERMETYGFRGEALSALCEISGEVFITTKTKQDTVATCYKLDRNGSILSESASGSIAYTGTMVSIYQPFAHLPVRRQVAEKTKVSSLKRIHELVVKYGLSHPFTRFCLNQQQSTLGKTKGQPVWIKPSTQSLTEGVRIIYGATLASMVEECSFEENFDQQVDLNDKSTSSPIRLHCLLPSKSSDPSQIFKGERVFIYVDKRPINYAKSDLKELVSMVRQRYKKVLGLEDDSKKIPFMYIDIQSGFGGYDVNMEPDKSVVLFVGKDRLMNAMQELLDQTYGSFFNNNPLVPAAERHPFKINYTLQEVPCHSPELPSKNIHHSSPSQLIEIVSDLRNSPPTQIEFDELDNDIYEPATSSPPLLNDWLQQHSLTDDIYKTTTSTNQLPTVTMGNLNIRNSPRATTENANLDWQIDKESDIGTTAPPSPVQIQQSSPYSDVQHTSHLSNWFAQFRRSSNGSNNNIAKRPATNQSPMSSTPPQAKRPATNQSPMSPTPPQAKHPRVQLRLPFTQAHSTSIASPILRNTDSSSPIISPQQSPTITNAGLFLSPATVLSSETDHHHINTAISPPTIPSMIPPVSTQRRDVLNEQSSQTRSILTNSSATSRRRDIATLFNKLSEPLSSSCTQDQELAIGLTSTLNETATLESPTTMIDMATGYNLFRRRYVHLHRKSVAEYHQQALSLQATLTKDQRRQSSWNSLLPEIKTHRELTVFTEGTYSDIGWLENCLAVMNIKMLQQRYKFQMLMDEYELKCGKPLTIPVQIEISDNSSLYGVIISLDKKEECIVDDGHGRTEQTYSSITDKRITANGFRARWRKEPYAHELVVQFTGISDLNGYGPTDFNEILAHIYHNIQQEQQHNGDNDGKYLTPLKKVRPAKVVDYFASKVKDMSVSTLAKSSESDWEHMLASLDEETQNHFTNGKAPQPSPVHYLV